MVVPQIIHNQTILTYFNNFYLDFGGFGEPRILTHGMAPIWWDISPDAAISRVDPGPMDLDVFSLTLRSTHGLMDHGLGSTAEMSTGFLPEK